MDDIILVASLDSMNIILKIFSSLHVRLQFTMEIDTEGKLSFLDTLIMINKYKIIFDRRRLSVRVDFLIFILCITKKVLSSILFDKIIKLSHPRFHEKNLVNAINIFLNNPLLFIFFNN